jgi:hypothetical protein
VEDFATAVQSLFHVMPLGLERQAFPLSGGLHHPKGDSCEKNEAYKDQDKALLNFSTCQKGVRQEKAMTKIEQALQRPNPIFGERMTPIG